MIHVLFAYCASGGSRFGGRGQLPRVASCQGAAQAGYTQNIWIGDICAIGFLRSLAHHVSDMSLRGSINLVGVASLTVVRWEGYFLGKTPTPSDDHQKTIR